MTDRIIDRIHDARRRLCEKGIQPSVLYVGKEEWVELKAWMHRSLITRSENGETRMMGMDTFVVEMPSHLRVY